MRSAIEARSPDRPDRLDHAYFQAARPVDLIIENVEALWAPIADADNWDPFNEHLAHMEQARQAYDWPAA